MKKMKKIMLFAACAAMLASCSNDEDFAPQQNALPEDGVIRISASVNQLVASHADADVTYSSYEGKNLGLYIRPSDADSWVYNETTNKYTYPNVKFDKSGDEWSQYTYSQMLWKGSGVNYEYYAYAPYDGLVSGGKIPFDLTTTNQTDLLWASETGTASALLNGQKKLDIQFEHAFCKVAVEISLADEFYQNDAKDNPITGISISSSRVKGNIDMFTGDVYVNSENAEDENNPTAGNLSFTISDDEHTASGRLTDGTYKSSEIFYAPGKEKFEIIITTDTGGRTYTYTHSSEYEFERGKKYIIKLKMGKDVVQMGGITATQWQDAGNAGDLETE